MNHTTKARTVATIEARMGSSRLAGKVLMPLGQKPALLVLVERLKACKELDDIVIATTTNKSDDPIQKLAEDNGILLFRGSEEDVLGRVLGAAHFAKAELLVEITGDCPLMDPALVDRAVREYLEKKDSPEGVDYVSNILEAGYPVGFAVQVFSTDLLKEVEQKTQDPADREHVSLYIYEKKGRYRLHSLSCPSSFYQPDWRLTLDYQEDYDLISKIHENLSPKNPLFGLDLLVPWLLARPELLAINSHRVQKKAR